MRRIQIPSISQIPLYNLKEKDEVTPSPRSRSNASGVTRSSSNAESTSMAAPRLVKSILYGSQEGQKEEAELEQSYGKVLARGKYVHEIQFHKVKPDRTQEYCDLVGKTFPMLANDAENRVNLVGSWKTEVGDIDTFVHIWEYHGYAGYHRTLEAANSLPIFKEYQKKISELVVDRRRDLMQEFSFWNTAAPRTLGGLFELRSYRLHPGNLLEWETHWRKGLECRRQVMEPVGAWFTQLGALNTVHHLWQYTDLQHRKISRDRCWQLPGWSDTVHKTVPLIETMDARILVPLEFSPIR